MYAAVFLACVGVLYMMDKMTGKKDVPVEETVIAQESTTAAGDITPFPTQETTEEETVPETQEEESKVTWNSSGYRYKNWDKKLPDIWTPPVEEEKPYEPPRIILATDIHYQSHDAEDDGKAFQNFVENCDGKVVEYLPQLLEAFLDEVIAEHPTALVLSGDITMNGEKINHEELGARLARVMDAGIQVLVIPGNHDINNPNAALYFGDWKTPAEQVTGEEFYEIYRRYGSDQAFSRDSASLSYAYALDEKNWVIMIDSAQYNPTNKVVGRIQDETLSWMDGILAQAKEQGIFVLPIAHHNLLAQSRMYPTECVMENSPAIIDLFQKYELPLFMSGHLHVQRIRQHRSGPGAPTNEYGIQEIITDAMSIPPCQYGTLTWKMDGSLEYATRSVDVSAWAKKNNISDENLLNFPEWSHEYIETLIANQIRRQIRNLGEDIISSMSSLYAQVYMDYYAGRKIDKKAVSETKGYRFWERNLPDSRLLDEINRMMDDADRDNNYWSTEG